MNHRRFVSLAMSFFIVTFLCLTAPVGNRLACATWDELAGSATGGGVSNNVGNSGDVSLALDSFGNPHIAWDDWSGGDLEIYYAYWDGTNWTTYGGANTGGGLSNNTGLSGLPSLALDGTNYPHISWYDDSGGDVEVYYAYWDGTNWVTRGGANTGGGVSNNTGSSNSGLNWRPSLVLDGSDNPHIAWDDNSGGDYEIYYAYWNGTSWTTYGGANTGGGVSNNTGLSGWQSLALDSFGNPHIAWEEDGPIPYPSTGNDEIYYAYWDGSNWVTHGGGNTGGGVSNNADRSWFPSIALDSSDNPHIAWNDGSSVVDFEIYYAYWDGDSWETLGGANTGGGVSNNTGWSELASLVLDSNNPYIAWDDNSGGDTEIYYAFWNGSAWKTRGKANTGGGLSKNGRTSSWPSLAIDNGGNPHIAWHDDWCDPSDFFGCLFGGNQNEVYYRYWNPAGGTTTSTIATTTTTISATSTTVPTTTTITTIAGTTTTIATTTTTTSTTTTTIVDYLCQCPDDSVDPTGCISGSVSNLLGQPLAGKVVVLSRGYILGTWIRKTIRTDSNGCYHFSNLEDGTYEIKVKKCKRGGTKTVVISGGEKEEGVNFVCK